MMDHPENNGRDFYLYAPNGTLRVARWDDRFKPSVVLASNMEWDVDDYGPYSGVPKINLGYWNGTYLNNGGTPDTDPVNDNDPIKVIINKLIYRPPGYGPPEYNDGVYPSEYWQNVLPQHPGSVGPANQFVLPKPKRIIDVYNH